MLAIALALGAARTPAERRPPEDAVFVAEDGGVLVHRGSGLRFPLEVAGFRRSDAVAFAGNGDYVGLEYVRTVSVDGELTLRIAAVSLPGLSAYEHYVITRPLTLQSLDDARPIAEGPFRSVENSEAYRGVFTGRVNGVPWTRGLWTFEHGEWDLRVRADFPRIDQIEADKAVAEFVTALNTLNGRVWERQSDPGGGPSPRPSAGAS